MKPYFVLIALVLVFVPTANSSFGQTPTKAKTENGRDVLLYPDGTWKYSNEEALPPPRPADINPRHSPTARKAETERGDFVIWYDDAKWQLENRMVEDGKLHFQLRRQDGYAMVLAEGISMPMETLREVAIHNAKDAAPDARLVSEDKQTIGGKEVMVLTIDGTIKGIPFRYFGYYYSGKQGTIQFIAFTGQNLFEKYKTDFINLLNGLEIKD